MLRRFLPSVVAYSSGEGIEICVADNASTDNSVDMLRHDFPDVRLILLEENYGFAEGYNRALAQVEATYALLLNSDVEVTPGWLTPMLAYMDAHPEVAACQPKVRSFYRKEEFEHAGACGGFIDKYGYPFCRGRMMDTVEVDAGQYDSVASIFWATGAALLIRTADYRVAGGLDARFFAHMEEIDLCWRLRSRGRSIVCIPQSVVYQVGGEVYCKSHCHRRKHSDSRSAMHRRTHDSSSHIDDKVKPVHKSKVMQEADAGCKLIVDIIFFLINTV